jgi:hypothetical protein
MPVMQYFYFQLAFEIAEEKLYWWKGRIQIWKKLTSWVKTFELYDSSVEAPKRYVFSE